MQARDRQAMQAISWLGSQGMLEEPEPSTKDSASDAPLPASNSTVVPETPASTVQSQSS
jgi:hypothetical protein